MNLHAIQSYLKQQIRTNLIIFFQVTSFIKTQSIKKLNRTMLTEEISQ